MTVRAHYVALLFTLALNSMASFSCGLFVSRGHAESQNENGDISFDDDDDDNDTSETSSTNSNSDSSTSSSSNNNSSPFICRELEVASRSIVSASCSSCHSIGGPGANNGFDYILDVGKMVENGKIAPNSASESPFFTRMLNGSMPPKDSNPRPSEDDIETIGKWIDNCVASFTPTDKILSTMLEDIVRLDLEDRRFIRYFSLVHIRNAGASRDEIDNIRYALRRAVNSLSREPGIRWPEPIDSRELIYRIDLRDYGWSAGTWRDIVDENPFAIEYLEADADELKLFSDEDVPFVLADWFVNASMQPPLYYDILDIPQTLGGLENQLETDIVDNIEDAEVERAGFLESEVSNQNRVIERHALPFANNAGLWISYDFAANGGNENIFANPLDFEEDGSEIIFSLPNGIHAYSIVDSNGRRLDAAPDELVVDPEQPNADVVAGISCIGCHDQGIIPREDELRDFVVNSLDFNLNTKRDIEDIHPRNSEWIRRLERDQDVFLSAIRELNPPKSLYGDGITPVFYAFDETVSLRRAAAEFGVKEEFLRERLTKLNSDLAQLATVDISREVFETHFAESVCLLKIGLADDRACD